MLASTEVSQKHGVLQKNSEVYLMRLASYVATRIQLSLFGTFELWVSRLFYTYTYTQFKSGLNYDLIEFIIGLNLQCYTTYKLNLNLF